MGKNKIELLKMKCLHEDFFLFLENLAKFYIARHSLDTLEIKIIIYNSVARLLDVENVSSMLLNDMVFFCCYRNMDCGQSLFWLKL
jgi:hypothetical protein